MKFDSVPKPGDRLFTTGGEVDIDLNFMRFSEPYRRYIRGFLIGAECLLKELRSNLNELSNGHLFITLAYLHRHCVELQLKFIIRYSNLTKSSAITEKQYFTHDLKKLWELVRPIIESIFSSDRKHLPAIEKVIHELYLVDPDGEDFRFPVRREKKDRPKSASMELVPRTFSLDKFVEALESVHSFLEYVGDGFEGYYDQLNTEHQP